MTKKVNALQENRDLAFRRAVSAARANIFTRDQALQELDMDPIDNKPVYVGPVTGINSGGIPTGANADEVANDILGEDTAMGTDAQLGNDTAVEDAGEDPAVQLEKKQFKAFAAKRTREGHPERISEFRWLHTPVHLRVIDG
jgi:hypothetical protein